MASTASLAFRLLDAHVIGGRADDLAVQVDGWSITYARLLHDSAGLAAGLRWVGCEPGHRLGLDTVKPRIHVVSLLAGIRLGLDVHAGPAPATGAGRVLGDPAHVEVGAVREAWDLVLRAGRGDPEPAAAADPHEAYATSMLQRHDVLLTPLLAGDTATSLN